MDGLIFDIDGTLWDSRESVAHAWQEAVSRRGNLHLDLSVEAITPLFGKTGTEIEEILFSGLTADKAERKALMESCFQHELEYLRKDPGVLYDGIREMLEKLRKKFPLFIVSNCQSGYAETMLQTTGLESFFRDHLCFGDTGRPKGENIQLLVQQYNLKEPVYIGDTQGDLQACRLAGIPMVYVTYGLGQADSPDFTADSPEEVCRILLEQ